VPVTEPRSPRAERARASIAEALLSLIDDGDLQPTANRIAERAGISLRLIYHHFGDLESLYQEASRIQFKRLMERFVPVPPDLPYAERLTAFVEQRARIYEWQTPVRRSAMINEHGSETLQQARSFGTTAARLEFEKVFATEIDRIPGDERPVALDALALLAGWPAWDELRTSGRTVEQATAAVAHGVTVLLRAQPG
jgi:TetR/AcrR family transcriptional regulator of autoinduction and epiphytic fitness